MFCAALSSHTGGIRSVSAQHPLWRKNFLRAPAGKNLFAGETDFLNCGQRKALSRVRDFSHALMQAAFSDAAENLRCRRTLASKYRLIRRARRSFGGPLHFWRLNSVKLSAAFHFSAGLPVFVPGVDNNRCLLQHCQLLRAEMPAINDRLVDVFAEIAPGTDEIAILTDILAPGVLDLPAVRPAIGAEMNPGQEHGVRRGTVAALEPAALGHSR